MRKDFELIFCLLNTMYLAIFPKISLVQMEAPSNKISPLEVEVVVIRKVLDSKIPLDPKAASSHCAYFVVVSLGPSN